MAWRWGFGWRGGFGWRRGWSGPWPGNGPFNYLPPWERPGWRYGPGSCWSIFPGYGAAYNPHYSSYYRRPMYYPPYPYDYSGYPPEYYW